MAIVYLKLSIAYIYPYAQVLRVFNLTKLP